jgi:SecD/SecF fusion protein
MRKIYQTAVLVLAVLALCWYSIVPLEKQLKLGKDLRGGVSLVYAVQIKQDENAKAVLDQTINVLKQRINPTGTLDITFVAQGNDRIEVTMPLPSDKVKGLKAAFEAELQQLGRTAMSEARFDSIVRMDAAGREKAIAELFKEESVQKTKLQAALAAADEANAAKESERAARAANKSGPEYDALVVTAGEAIGKFDAARAEFFKGVVAPEEVARILNLSNKTRMLEDPQAKDPAQKRIVVESPRERGIKALKAAHPEATAQIDRIIAAQDAFLKERTTLDDPQDLIRLLKGAGVISFRITVDPAAAGGGNITTDEDRLRTELRTRGAQNVRSTDARWYKVNQIENWYTSTAELAFLQADPAAFFASRGYVGDMSREGEYYILCWDVRGKRLTADEGDWRVKGAQESADELGKPSIAFQMDPLGGTLLGNMTREPAKTNNKMAILLDDQVYTAPRLQSAISRSGQITGVDEREERDYVIRVLNAGSLQAKLSPKPLSIQSIGPALGADNLQNGLKAGLVALVVVSGFMIVYYFGCGIIAVVALLANALMIVGMMALAKAAFTMPGIAGVILTFGMAVDANVLIYERMREEMNRGAELKTAVRLGFSKALSSIVDGNVTNLIVCVVLAYVGTPEVKGFAVTMGIGVVATLFAALVITRLVFDVLVLKFGWKRTSMLPMAVPAIQRALTPRVNWMRMRYVFFTLSTIYVAMGLYAVFVRGDKMLHIEFLGGTQVEVQFAKDPKTGTPITLERAEVEDRIRKAAADLSQDDPSRTELQSVDVTPINPDVSGVRSNWFLVKTTAIDEATVRKVVGKGLAGLISEDRELRFDSMEQADWRKAPVYRVDRAVLGDVIERAAVRSDVRKFEGGVAIVVDKIEPAVSLDSLRARIEKKRGSPEYSDTLSRTSEFYVLAGDESAVSAVAVLIRDESASFMADEDRWADSLAKREWNLVRDSLTVPSTSASVQNFSPAIASTFKAQAIAAVLLSFVLIAIYIWVRFKGARFSMAAVVATLHDVLTVIGAVALCGIIWEMPSLHGFAHTLGLKPFKIDLNMVAAMLAVAGYSLNDTIIIMDRIREIKGKLPYASADMINDAINHTISRTIITSGTTVLCSLILYIFGGEGVRPFAFALLVGIGIGTYSSIAVAGPIVWSRKGNAAQDAPKGVVANAT